MNTVQYVVASLFIVAGGLCVIRGRADQLFGLGLVSLGFGNFWIFALGSIWLPFKIVGIWNFVYIAVASGRKIRETQISLKSIYHILVILTVFGCVLGYTIPVPGELAGTTGTQGAVLRPAIQFLAYLIAFSYFPLAREAARFEGSFERIVDYYAAAAILVALVGLYQFVALKLGLGFMPIYRAQGFESRSIAAFAYGDAVVQRLYSLAGEPKSLGIFLTPFVVMGIALAFRERRVFPRWWNRKIFFLIAAFVDIMTYSSAVLIALGVIAIALALLDSRGWIRVAAVVAVFAILAGNTVMTGNSANHPQGGVETLENLVYARTVDRVATEYQERNETAALELLWEHPEYALAGVGLGMYPFHLPGLYFGTGIEPIDSGWVVVLMDLGLLGGVFLGLLVWRVIFTALGQASCAPPDAVRLQLSALCVLANAALLLGTGSFVPLMMWSGLTAALIGYSNRRVRPAPGFHNRVARESLKSSKIAASAE